MSSARQHAEWLSLVEVSGPFLAMGVLCAAFPQGLDDDGPEVRQRLRVAHDEWAADQEGSRPDPAIHRQWVRYVLREALEVDDRDLLEGQSIPSTIAVTVAEHHETLRPTYAILNPPGRDGAGVPRLLVDIVPARQDVDKPLAGRAWAASPATRMMAMLHGLASQAKGPIGARLGLVTNGRQWMLVHAAPGETTTFATFHAHLFFEEPITLRAFRSLVSVRRLLGVADDEALESLFAKSAKDQHEVTDQLGLQVRHAVEVLVQGIDRVDRDRGRALLRGFDERRLYEAAVTVMMRLVFLFAAEERGLLLLGHAVYDRCYAVSTLRDQLQEIADRQGEEVLERRYDAWCRLLATFRAVHAGVSHEDLTLPAYGGSLFDPDRFPFLEGRAAGTSWRDAAGASATPLAIDDRTVLHLLRSLQLLEVKVPGGSAPETRRLSFRALDVEQIGHVYEGLLDHTAKRARGVVLGLAGSREPEIPVADLDRHRRAGDEALVRWLAEQTGRSENAVRNGVAYRVTADDDRKILLACENRRPLYDAVVPWAGLVRKDAAGLPVVIDDGGVYVTEGDERRATGTHYTPRSLTEPIVRYTLEPLVYEGPAEGWAKEDWKLRPAAEILALRVCDLAMGSGAFLVQACRYLADRVVEAWAEAEKKAAGQIAITPDGAPSRGQPSERPLPRDPDERLAIARRIVADRCLYGVDKNPMAVEMAKLSLWLVTLQKDRPFTFVDHALRCGDSLLGLTTPEQLEQFHMDPDRGKRVHATFQGWTAGIGPALHRALELRRKLESFTVETVEDAAEKARLLGEAESALADARLIGDLVIGAALSTATRGEKALDDALIALSSRVAQWLGGKPIRAELAREAERLINEGRQAHHAERRPFHWVIEFPEVLAEGRRGFDGVIGNPPFLGGTKLEPRIGTDVRAAIVRHLAGGQTGARGAADLCVYFMLRQLAISANHGVTGLVATSSVTQGDSRDVGLQRALSSGFWLFRANGNLPWPGVATVHYHLLWLARRDFQPAMLDDRPVRRIDTNLAPSTEQRRPPQKLASNEGIAFEGNKLGGEGFVCSDAEARSLIAEDPRSREVLHPYLTGAELNARANQAPSQWAICFRDWPLTRQVGHAGPTASDYPACLRHVERNVRPARDALPPTTSWNRKLSAYWWHFGQFRWAMESSLAGKPRAIALSRVGAFVALAFVPTSYILSDRLTVFALSDDWALAVLQSTFHHDWAWLYGTTNLSLLSYSPSECFLTFPLPPPPSRARLGAAGRAYDQARNALMAARAFGLLGAYQLLHDPDAKGSDVVQLRRLHAEMDQAVAAAYGWTDLDLGHGFHETKQGIRYTISEPARREVLDWLLELNHQRYAEEVAQGLHDDGKKKPRAPKPAAAPAPKPAPKAPPAQTGFSFDARQPAPKPAAPEVAAFRAPPEPARAAKKASPAHAIRAVLAAAREPMGKSAILEASGVADADWAKAIRELLERGVVVQEGERRGARYRLRRGG